MTIPPDTKDWTWVLEKPCPECGFDSSAVDLSMVGDLLVRNAATWGRALSAPEVAVRPAVDHWSVLEYACHVRDVHTVMTGRLRAMLTQDDPEFENWDQDAAAVEGGYAAQDPARVARELQNGSAEAATLLAEVTAAQWERRGRRSNGSHFTVDSLTRYYVHDLVHHVWDVTGQQAG